MRSKSTAPREGARSRARAAILGLLVLPSCHPASPTPPAQAPADATSESAQDPDPDPDADPHADPTRRVHLTFDDAPWMAEPGQAAPSADRVMEVNEAIVNTLGARGVAASVFFNCDRLQRGETSIELWADSGAVVGNHTSSHANLADTPLDEWIADVDRCHEILRARLPHAPRWFRYPYLSQGDSEGLRDAAQQRLAAMGYANAHVTVATTEWLLAYAYREAKRRGDEALQAEIVEAYRDHLVEAIEQGRTLAVTEVGRPTAQVALLHVNELAADHLGDVLDGLEARGWSLVGLQEALDDPVFERPDHYAGRGGLSWLARIHPTARPRPPYWFGEEEQRLMKRYGDLFKPPNADDDAPTDG